MDLKSIIVQNCAFGKYQRTAQEFGVEGFHDDPKYNYGLIVRSLRFPSVDVLFDSFLQSPYACRVKVKNWGRSEHFKRRDLSDEQLAYCKSIVSSCPEDKNICKFNFRKNELNSGIYLNVARVDGKYVVYEVWCSSSNSDLLLASSVPFSGNKPLLEAIISPDTRFVEVK